MIITISREHGASGRLLAEHLAETLGYRVTGKHLVAAVAHEAGVSLSEALAHDEQADRSLTYILKKAFVGGGAADLQLHGQFGGLTTLDPKQLEVLDEDRYAVLSRDAILEAAEKEDLVLLGRAGQAILAGREDAVHVRVVGTLKDRAAFLRTSRGLSDEDALAVIEKVDSARSRYIQRHFDLDPVSPSHYDLVVNTGRMSVVTAASAVMQVVRDRAKRIGDDAGVQVSS